MKVGSYCHLKLTPLKFIVNLKRKNSFQTLVLRCTFLGGEVTGYPLRDAERPFYAGDVLLCIRRPGNGVVSTHWAD